MALYEKLLWYHRFACHYSYLPQPANTRESIPAGHTRTTNATNFPGFKSCTIRQRKQHTGHSPSSQQTKDNRVPVYYTKHRDNHGIIDLPDRRP